MTVTTHSDYLLEQLSSFLLLGKVAPSKRYRKYRYRRDDYLRADEVAVNLFSLDKKHKGNRITEVDISEDDGISQDEFVKIQETLYEETIKLRRDISSKK